MVEEKGVVEFYERGGLCGLGVRYELYVTTESRNDGRIGLPCRSGHRRLPPHHQPHPIMVSLSEPHSAPPPPTTPSSPSPATSLSLLMTSSSATMATYPSVAGSASPFNATSIHNYQGTPLKSMYSDARPVNRTSTRSPLSLRHRSNHSVVSPHHRPISNLVFFSVSLFSRSRSTRLSQRSTHSVSIYIYCFSRYFFSSEFRGVGKLASPT